MRRLERFVVKQSREERGLEEVSSDLPFDVSKHEAAHTAIAMSMLQRIENDVAAYARSANSEIATRLKTLTDQDIQTIFDNVTESASLDESLSILEELNQMLQDLQESDALVIEKTIPLIEVNI